jgi:hypothetical protein
MSQQLPPPPPPPPPPPHLHVDAVVLLRLGLLVDVVAQIKHEVAGLQLLDTARV